MASQTQPSDRAHVGRRRFLVGAVGFVVTAGCSAVKPPSAEVVATTSANLTNAGTSDPVSVLGTTAPVDTDGELTSQMPATSAVTPQHSVAAGTSAETFEVSRTDAEWQQLLTPAQYGVLRGAGTEAPFSSPLNDEWGVGDFTCAGCDLNLFASTTKFESSTGWPSFWQVMENSVLEVGDDTFGMMRTAVMCRRCGGHLGHVFDDGPQPTGLRYCMNGVALTYRPRE